MIVELNRVGLEAEAHPAALRTFLAVDRDLTGKRRVRPAPKEVQDVAGAQRGDRGGSSRIVSRAAVNRTSLAYSH
jgi:hypothetical protein